MRRAKRWACSAACSSSKLPFWLTSMCFAIMRSLLCFDDSRLHLGCEAWKLGAARAHGP